MKTATSFAILALLASAGTTLGAPLPATTGPAVAGSLDAPGDAAMSMATYAKRSHCGHSQLQRSNDDTIPMGERTVGVDNAPLDPDAAFKSSCAYMGDIEPKVLLEHGKVTSTAQSSAQHTSAHHSTAGGGSDHISPSANSLSGSHDPQPTHATGQSTPSNPASSDWNSVKPESTATHHARADLPGGATGALGGLAATATGTALHSVITNSGVLGSPVSTLSGVQPTTSVVSVTGKGLDTKSWEGLSDPVTKVSGFAAVSVLADGSVGSSAPAVKDVAFIGASLGVAGSGWKSGLPGGATPTHVINSAASVVSAAAGTQVSNAAQNLNGHGDLKSVTSSANLPVSTQHGIAGSVTTGHTGNSINVVVNAAESKTGMTGTSSYVANAGNHLAGPVLDHETVVDPISTQTLPTGGKDHGSLLAVTQKNASASVLQTPGKADTIVDVNTNDITGSKEQDQNVDIKITAPQKSRGDGVLVSNIVNGIVGPVDQHGNMLDQIKDDTLLGVALESSTTHTSGSHPKPIVSLPLSQIIPHTSTAQPASTTGSSTSPPRASASVVATIHAVQSHSSAASASVTQSPHSAHSSIVAPSQIVSAVESVLSIRPVECIPANLLESRPLATEVCPDSMQHDIHCADSPTSEAPSTVTKYVRLCVAANL